MDKDEKTGKTVLKSGSTVMGSKINPREWVSALEPLELVDIGEVSPLGGKKGKRGR